MGSFICDIGKGLREPCSPYREANVFGAGLNEPNADNWNCIPKLVKATTSYDLSAISKGHEVVVALLGVSNAISGFYHIRFRWYRERDDALLYDYIFDYTAFEGGWLYGYSYIGYNNWEISENGSYRVRVDVSGVESYTREISFTVSGILVEEPEPIPPEGFFPAIVEQFNSISRTFYSAYIEVYYWVWPFNYLATPFYFGSVAFAHLAQGFSSFATAWYGVVNKLTLILSWSTIWSYILTYIPNLEAIRDWFYYWWTFVWNEINEWWEIKKQIVLGWVDAVKDWARLWFIYFEAWLKTLQAEWDYFKKVTLPSLPDWLGIDKLIASWFEKFAPFWEGWQEVKEKITDFIKDPEEWFYNRLDEIFERYW